MKPSEVVRVFEAYHRLLALYEPTDAVLWLIRPQGALADRSPCELLPHPQGYQEVLTLIERMSPMG
jgi:uncharacterized protein (DUF2384 family)